MTSVLVFLGLCMTWHDPETAGWLAALLVAYLVLRAR